MGNPFEIEIAAARQKKLRIGLAALAAFFVVLSIFAASYIYIASVRFEVVLKSYQSDVQLSVINGNAINYASDRVFLFSGRADVKVTAAGYQSEIVQLSKNYNSRKVTVTLEYAAVEVYFEATEELSNPIWHLDGAFVSSNADIHKNLFPGDYQVELFSDHHESVSLPFKVYPAESIRQVINVARKTVSYQVVSMPTGAEVFIDDQYIGKTPIAGTIPSSAVHIEVKSSGYETASEIINLSKIDDSLKRNYNLRKGMYQVPVSYNPLGGRIFVDGVEKSISDQLTIRSTGAANIVYSKKGYASEAIRVDRNSNAISFNLEPVFGSVIVRSTPPALIEVEGISYGETPLKVKLQATDQSITFNRAGYVPKKVPLKVIESELQAIDVSLQTWSDYYLAQSKAKLTNKAGVNLVRFFPKAFKMGAPRSQHGQRANELIRSVQFSRAIYMSEHEVTEQQYASYAGGGPSSRIPVTNVSWIDAALFCNWLSLKEGLEPFYKIQRDVVIGFNASSLGYRLPTEAEWEYVARYANKKSPSIFTWGDEYEITQAAGNVADEDAKGIVRTFISDYEDGHRGKAAVGSFAREKSGLFDMSGNVSEWVHDIYSIELPDDNKTYIDFLGASRGSQHVVKGSNYMSSSWTEFRASFKEFSDGPEANVGFRVARYIN